MLGVFGLCYLYQFLINWFRGYIRFRRFVSREPASMEADDLEETLSAMPSDSFRKRVVGFIQERELLLTDAANLTTLRRQIGKAERNWGPGLIDLMCELYEQTQRRAAGAARTQ